MLHASRQLAAWESLYASPNLTTRRCSNAAPSAEYSLALRDQRRVLADWRLADWRFTNWRFTNWRLADWHLANWSLAINRLRTRKVGSSSDGHESKRGACENDEFQHDIFLQPTKMGFPEIDINHKQEGCKFYALQYPPRRSFFQIALQ